MHHSSAINLNCRVHVYLIILRKSARLIYMFYIYCNFEDLLVLTTNSILLNALV